jgi:hypothetical protein
MRLTAVAKAAGVLLAAASFVAPAAVVATPAHADQTQDDTFVQYLSQKGVPYGREMDAVRMAKSTCLALSRQGSPGAAEYAAYQDLKKEMGLNVPQAEIFAQAAVYEYCPQAFHINQQ